jgi:uncharacterized membrane protein
MSRNIENIMWPWVSIALFFSIAAGIYISNFHGYGWSEKPSDWGVIGDYFGGLMNPLISTITLFFLIKAYISQREELRETREALQKTEEHSRKTADSQLDLIKTQARQALINEKIMRIQLLSCKIDSKYKKVNFLQKELERCTEAKVNNRNYVDLEGKKLSSDGELEVYRSELIKKISEATDEIEKINLQIEKESAST